MQGVSQKIDSQSGDRSDLNIAVVVPCYREADRILNVLAKIGPEVSHILVVDDACPDGTGALVESQCTDPRVEVITHTQNQGVGGATLTGYGRAVELGVDVIVKIDGDGQMDPSLISSFVAPIVAGYADYTKGNRFYDMQGLSGMPRVRIAGNLVLSFATKMSSGYWNIFDPTNGYTAIHSRVARLLPTKKISKGYFFESDMLFRLNILRAVVMDIPMQAHYGDEQSGLRIPRAVIEFAGKHCVNTFKRIFYSYYLRDFNVASIELVFGAVMVLFGLFFGAVQWAESLTTGIAATAGTVILAALPIILGSQLLIAFLDFDTRNIPSEAIHPRREGNI